jgi:cyclopropane-fatty-acyl-phospholipid synthase
MNSIATTLKNKSLPLGVKPLLRILDRLTVGTLQLVTPDGQTLTFGSGCKPYATLELSTWKGLRSIFRKGDVGLAEAYRDGLIFCDDLTALLRIGIANQKAIEKAVNGNAIMRFAYRLRHLLNANTHRGSKRNIQAHYDLGNDFYRLWLDPTMTYSSALFRKSCNEDLATAQIAKYQRILELSGAQAGDTILEIGCGWGGFAEHAARRGIKVQGITLSHEQLKYARERIERAGLSNFASFKLQDYREIKGQFDHIVSIEMIEAVGEQYWNSYFQQIKQMLKPGGNVVIQSITIDDKHFESYRRGSDFIQQYIFPGGMLPSQQRLTELVVDNGMHFKTMHGFGRDYAETLRRWRDAFERQREMIHQQGFDERFVRIWRFYLSYCEAAFDEQNISVVHLTFSHREP